MGDSKSEPARYQDVFTDPLARRMWMAAAISNFGDFIGLGALLLIAYDRSGGRPLGPSAVFAVQAIPAVTIATLIGPWLDKIPRIRGLVSLCLIGAASLALPLVFSGLWPVLTAAGFLGGVRTAFNSIRSGTIADSVPRRIRPRLLALMNLSYQTSEVIGYFAGSTVTLVVGVDPALAADAVTFVVAALLLTGLRVPAPSGRRRRAALTTGISTIFADQTLAVLAPIAWVGLTMGAVPASLATTELHGSYRGWVPLAMAACAAGLASAGAITGRTNLAERVQGQLWYIAAGGACFAVTAAGLEATPLLLIAGNFAAGVGMGWSIATQTTFLLVIAPERMAHVTSTMIASLIALEGIGAVVFGTVANSLGVPAAYLLVGVLEATAALMGIGYARLHPHVLDITRPRDEVAA
jgi:Major Facilitator Superfamily